MARTKKIPLSEQFFGASAHALPAGLRNGLDGIGKKADTLGKIIAVAAFLAVLISGVIKGLKNTDEFH